MEFFSQNNYFSKNQFGFIKGRSTALQLLCIMDDWTKNLDIGAQVDVIYTDFAKAFDTVSLQIINQQSRETVVGTSASITVSSVTTLNSIF